MLLRIIVLLVDGNHLNLQKKNSTLLKKKSHEIF